MGIASTIMINAELKESFCKCNVQILEEQSIDSDKKSIVKRFAATTWSL